MLVQFGSPVLPDIKRSNLVNGYLWEEQMERRSDNVVPRRMVEESHNVSVVIQRTLPPLYRAAVDVFDPNSSSRLA